MRSGLHSISYRKKTIFFVFILMMWWYVSWYDAFLCFNSLQCGYRCRLHWKNSTTIRPHFFVMSSCFTSSRAADVSWPQAAHHAQGHQLPPSCTPWPCVCVCAMRVCLRVLVRALCLMPAGLPPCRGHKACSLSPASFSAVWGHWCQNGRAAWAAAKSESPSHRILEFHQLVDELAGRGGWGGGAGTYGCGFDSEVR